jgi:hypothetical protein
MAFCLCPGHRNLTEKLNFNVRESDAGFTVEVTPKDPSETGTLKGLVKGVKTFLGGGDCC